MRFYVLTFHAMGDPEPTVDAFANLKEARSRYHQARTTPSTTTGLAFYDYEWPQLWQVDTPSSSQAVQIALIQGEWRQWAHKILPRLSG